jgi:hypothetical protein
LEDHVGNREKKERRMEQGEERRTSTPEDKGEDKATRREGHEATQTIPSRKLKLVMGR